MTEDQLDRLREIVTPPPMECKHPAQTTQASGRLIEVTCDECSFRVFYTPETFLQILIQEADPLDKNLTNNLDM